MSSVTDRRGACRSDTCVEGGVPKLSKTFAACSRSCPMAGSWSFEEVMVRLGKPSNWSPSTGDEAVDYFERAIDLLRAPGTQSGFKEVHSYPQRQRRQCSLSWAANLARVGHRGASGPRGHRAAASGRAAGGLCAGEGAAEFIVNWTG